jgi:hypothetical protein
MGLQDIIVRNPKEAGKQFTLFLKNGGRMFVGGSKIAIDRTTPFNPTFIGEGWKIEEQDQRSLKLVDIDLDTVRFETMLESGEQGITGKERLKRLKKAGYILLDANILLTLWENKHLIPESWKEKIHGNIRYIFFDGTELLSPRDSRCTLYLYWNDGKWAWGAYWLGNDRNARNLSVVLAE